MKEIFKIETSSSIETINFAKKIFEFIPKDTKLIFLQGEVGSGKTTFVKGIASYLKIDDEIKSPTYSYKTEYPNLIHYDLYLSKKMKKKDVKSLISEDLEKGIVIIEWGENIPKIKNSISIDIDVIDFEKRNIRIKKN